MLETTNTDMHNQPPTIQTRTAQPTDAQAIASVLHQAFAGYEHLYTPQALAATTPTADQIEARMGEGETWVALHDGVIVGTVSVVPRENGVYVRSMAVLPEARGHRIGERLLEQIENYVRDNGYSRLFLSTTPFLDRAIRLYESYDFKRTNAGPQDLFGTPIFSMEKHLNEH